MADCANFPGQCPDNACHWTCTSATPNESQSPAAPGGDGKAEAREQIARALYAEDGERSGPGVDWLAYADAVLAVPAVADGLAAAEALRRVQAEITAWGDESREWYYDNRHTHPNGIAWCGGFEEGWDHAEQRLRRALGDHQ